jgi:hypothetical protein
MAVEVVVDQLLDLPQVQSEVVLAVALVVMLVTELVH